MISFSIHQITQLLNNCRNQTYQVQLNNKNIIFSTISQEFSEYFLKLAVEELRNHGYNAYSVKDEYGIIYPPGRRGQPQIIKTDDEPYKYDCAFWIRNEFHHKLELGHKIWIDEHYYNFNLSFLPPTRFGMLCKWNDAQIYADFVTGNTAFWSENNKYYCRNLNHI